mmetsp:Transcript_5634/g.4027  ORF Transcript_5634/g.4027 Transcript_5634/m.4027 type:complete len:106 (+) Transcript_5634:52-369(+)
MNFKHLKVDLVNDGKIAIMSLNKPKKMNALDMELFGEILQVCTNLNKFDSEFKEFADVRCVIFTGHGKNFTAGLDLAASKELMSKDDDMEPAKWAYRFMDNVDFL